MFFTVTKYLNLSRIKPFPKSIDDFVPILQEFIKILQENEFSSSKNIRLIDLLSERHMKRTISKSSLTDFQLILCVVKVHTPKTDSVFLLLLQLLRHRRISIISKLKYENLYCWCNKEKVHKARKYVAVSSYCAKKA